MTSLAEILQSCGVFQPVFEDRMLNELFDGLLPLPVSLFTTNGVGWFSDLNNDFPALENGFPELRSRP